jgi:hypothetical protein
MNNFVVKVWKNFDLDTDTYILIQNTDFICVCQSKGYICTRANVADPYHINPDPQHLFHLCLPVYWI